MPDTFTGVGAPSRIGREVDAYWPAAEAERLTRYARAPEVS